MIKENNPKILKQNIMELVEENKRLRNHVGHTRNKSDPANESEYLRSQIELLEKKLFDYQVEINTLRSETGNYEVGTLL